MAAAYALGQMGAIAEPAGPALIETLKEERTATSIQALGAIGPAARSAVPALIRAVKRHTEKGLSLDLAACAVDALGRIGPDARTAVPSLVAALPDPSLDMGGAPPGLCSGRVAQALAGIGVPAVPALRRALHNRKTALRLGAVQALQLIGPRAKDAVPELRAALKDPDCWVRIYAAFALWTIDPRTPALSPVLLEALRSKEWEAQEFAGVVLHDMGPAARAAVPALVALLKDRKYQSPKSVVYALRGIRPPARTLVPVLAEVLRVRPDSNPWEAARLEAARTLRYLGREAAPAAPALTAALRGGLVETRIEAAAALGQIGVVPAATITELRGVLRDKEWTVRVEAAYTLGRLGAAARPAVPALANLLGDSCSIVRWAALTALERFGPEAVAAVPLLARVVSDCRGPFAQLEGNSNDDTQTLRLLRQSMLAGLYGSSCPYIDPTPATAAYLHDPICIAAARACRILGALGPTARPAISALRTALRSDDRVSVRLAAAAALVRIDPKALEEAQPSAKEVETLSADLAGTDPVKAYRALWSFVLAPRHALPWLRAHLTPVAPPDPARLARLIADLDSEVFRVRQEAMRQLKELGELAGPDLRAVLTRKPSLEVRRRAEQLLRIQETRPPTPQRIRALRAVAALERIGTPPACELLRSLAGGAAGASLTREAKAALVRLSPRPHRP